MSKRMVELVFLLVVEKLYAHSEDVLRLVQVQELNKIPSIISARSLS